ncbi:MAG: ATP-binding cassette domain-containing protein [Capsulimonadaceae bacterium]|nr:ATP-binding cassette domain-containing protein [Capsulimonadaceae bacterium]
MAARLPVLNGGSNPPIPREQPNHVVLKSVNKSFGASPVLSAVDFAIPYGQFVALIGKSGCGKSTLLRLVAGLETPSEGQILIDGAPLQGQNSGARVMFQDARLLPWKRVRDNVGIGRQGNWRDEADQALTEVGLLDRADDWPAVLSGGERQRVGLARALVSKPRLLLLDEPMSALDALTRIEMQRLIERLWHEHGFTVLLITHDVEEAVALADRVALLERGKIALDTKIELARPRQRTIAEFGQYEAKILEQVLGPAEE